MNDGWWTEVERAAREVKWSALNRLMRNESEAQASQVVFNEVGRLVDLIAKYEEDR